MLSYYGTKLSPNQLETDEGFLICRNVPIARTGTMEYLAGELGLREGAERLVPVSRSEEEVFDTAAMASFEGKPVTDGHPPESVVPENFSAYARGHVQNVRREGAYLVADLYINDALLASDIRNGVKREVSCGYLCRYVPDGAGYRQEHIRGNHVAVVPRGRAGREVAIQDQAAGEAEKGRNTMSRFAKAILTAFGLAAKEAQDEAEVHSLVDTALTALDAEPAGDTAPAPEAGPAVETPAADAAPSALEGRLDKLISLLEARDSKPEEPSGVEALDKLLEEEKEADPEEPDEPEEKAGTPLTGEARDAAMAILKHVRPAVAAIADSLIVYT